MLEPMPERGVRIGLFQALSLSLDALSSRQGAQVLVAGRCGRFMVILACAVKKRPLALSFLASGAQGRQRAHWARRARSLRRRACYRSGHQEEREERA